MIAAMNGNFEVVIKLTKLGANKGLLDIEGKNAREHAIDALEAEKAKKQQDIKSKKKMGDISKILQILPEQKKEAEINDSFDDSSNRPKVADNRI